MATGARGLLNQSEAVHRHGHDRPHADEGLQDRCWTISMAKATLVRSRHHEHHDRFFSKRRFDDNAVSARRLPAASSLNRA